MGVWRESAACVSEAQAYLRRRLASLEPPAEIHGYQHERRTLLEVVRRTAEFGESNSILLIGPRGSGKTMLLRSVLDELRQQQQVNDNLMEVHLNGLLQTDDRIALKEITRQLQLENAVGDKVFGTFAENLQFLLDALKSGGKQTKSILFALDEFDLFAGHKNQTLLYNLFDVAQSAQAPVCVLGITTRLDVLELLEKRVKSRFSHRQLHLLPALDFQLFVELFTSYLQLPTSFRDKKYAAEWNKRVQKMTREALVQDVLRKQYDVDRDVRRLHALMHMPIGRLSEQQPYLSVQDLVDAAQLTHTDSKAAMLHGVSVLELCLVIAMKHLTEIYDGAPFNFEMIYKEYQKYTTRKASIQTFDKAVVLKAFEHLVRLELVGPADGSSTRAQSEYRQMSMLVDASQVMTALQTYPGCPTDIRQWGHSSLT